MVARFLAAGSGDRQRWRHADVVDEATVGDLVDRLGLRQPQVSKHLAVLRTVGLVSVRTDGRHRWYRVNGPMLQPIYEWVCGFESTWNARLDQLDHMLIELQTKENQT